MNEADFEIYFSGLYSLYSVFNIFLPFISGKIRDKMGDRIVLIFMVILVLVGQIIFAYGVSIKNFWVMYIGRILSGWGIESVVPTQTQFVSPYFKDDYLGFAVGMNELFATFGSIATMYYCSRIAAEYGLIVAVSSGIIVNCVSILCGFVSTGIDKHAEDQLIKEVNYEKIKEYVEANNEPNVQPIDGISQRPQSVDSDFMEQMRSYPPIFWLVSSFQAIIYSSVLGFINISVGLLSERWYGVNEESEQKAGLLVAIMWLITGSFTPFFGCLTDKYGLRAPICVVAALLCSVSHILIWYAYPFFALLMLGTSLALAYASAWTGIVFLVRPDGLGKAYAVVVAEYNASFTVIPLLVGYLRAKTGTYFYSQIALSILGVIALIISLFIWKIDSDLEHILDGHGQYAISATSLENHCKIEEAEEDKQVAQDADGVQ